MTHSGNKPSDSEITNSDNRYYTALNTVSFAMQYCILDKEQSYHITSPLDGLLNILVWNNETACINPYFINHDSYLIRAGENIIHTIHQNDTLEWKNTNPSNVVIVVYIPNNIADNIFLKLDGKTNRFRHGLLTKSDSRILLNITQIIELNKHSNHLILLKIQALIIDVIVHQLEGLLAENDKQEMIIDKNHYDKIILAKKLIERDLTKNFTIAELAKLVGTNEQYLKKYFKQYFGKTVMHYTTDHKMKHAKELIMTGDYRVSDVARLTGYKHSTHFTTAFKKYFGFIPNSLRYTFLVAHEGTQQIITELETFINLL